MQELVSQIEFLQSECQKNQQAFEGLRSQFGDHSVYFLERPLMTTNRVFQSIIQSLEELRKLKSGS